MLIRRPFHSPALAAGPLSSVVDVMIHLSAGLPPFPALMSSLRTVRKATRLGSEGVG